MGYDVRTRRTLVNVLVRLILHVYRGHTLRHLINVTSVFPRIPRSQLIDVTSVFVGITQSTEKKWLQQGGEGTRETQSTQTPTLLCTIQ